MTCIDNMLFELEEARKACQKSIEDSWELVKNGMKMDFVDIQEKNEVVEACKARLIKAFPDWTESDSDSEDEVIMDGSDLS